MRLISDERGATLVELLLALVISVVVLSAGLSLTLVSQGGARRVQATVETASERGIVESQVSRLLRGITCPQGVEQPISAASAQSVSFYTDLDDAASVTPIPREVSFSDGRLIVGTLADGRWSRRELAGAIAPSSGKLVYRGVDGNALQTPVSTANLARVASIEVAYTRTPATRADSQVAFQIFAGDGRTPNDEAATFGCGL